MQCLSLSDIIRSTFRKDCITMSNEATPVAENIISNDRTAHRKAIKERIIAAVKAAGTTAYQLYPLVNDTSSKGDASPGIYDYGLSYPTFLRTCNPDYPNICNLDSCLAIARYLHLPLDWLFAPPEEMIQDVPSKIITYPAKPFGYLKNPQYFGTFYGYMHSLNIEHKDIEPFTLTIDEHGAKLCITSQIKKVLIRHRMILSYSQEPLFLPKKTSILF